MRFLSVLVFAVFIGAIAAAQPVVKNRTPVTIRVQVTPGGSSFRISIKIWSSATSKAMADQLCSMKEEKYSSQNGLVEVGLSDECMSILAAEGQIWIEETINGTASKRRQINVAPLSWEANRAREAVGALRAELDLLIPPGTIIAFGGKSAPDGWLPCDGALYECKTHKRLCQAIGINWGGTKSPSDEVITFRVPDLQGRFLRGVDHGRRDPDKGTTRYAEHPGQNCCDNVGSVQNDEIRSHSHAPDGLHRYFISPSSGGANTIHDGDDSPGEPNLWSGGIAAEQSRGGTESRPANANVEYLIRR